MSELTMSLSQVRGASDTLLPAVTLFGSACWPMPPVLGLGEALRKSG